MCTSIGTSVNLVAMSLAKDAFGKCSAAVPQATAPDSDGPCLDMHFFEPAWIGGPLCFIGLVYMVALAPHLLPATDHGSFDSALLEPEPTSQMEHEYQTQMRVLPQPHAGKTVGEAGLDTLAVGLRPTRLLRAGGDVSGPELAHVRLAEGDVLCFRGSFDVIKDVLYRQAGLESSEVAQAAKMPEGRSRRRLAIAVVAIGSELCGERISDLKFRDA